MKVRRQQMMPKKSFKKRIKITKTGKFMRRKQGQGHSRANKSRQVIRRKDGKAEVADVDYNNIAQKLN
jgi:ribosomal protein L35